MPQINIRVIPRARRNAVEPQSDGTYRIYTTAAPADGDANAAVIKMLAKHLGLAKSGIKIIRGQTARDKVIEY
ncbi:MAG: DUF167 domain-containing protein [Alphaproteobacteria bacterium]|nr:DUF167 domain-containing protein [Alphaproteobacteria bacterium]